MKPASRILPAILVTSLLLLPAIPTVAALETGLVRTKSAYPMAETIERLKKDLATREISFFAEIDQAKLAADEGIELNPSTLLIFGNPALGAQFMTSEPASGIDWPVRLLVIQDKEGQVWTIHNDFSYIARRHGITDRDEAFTTASKVIASITSTVKRK